MDQSHLTFANGDPFPSIGLGTWRASKGEVKDAVLSAIDLGYRHFDCAPIYENEQEIGEAFAEAFQTGKVKREDLFVTSKLWCDHHFAEDVKKGLRRTLEDLRLEYLDLYLVHWPIALQRDTQFPEKESDFIPPSELSLLDTWKGMEDAHNMHLCRHIGVSNVNARRLESLIEASNHKPEVNQVECHPFLQQGDLMDVCQKHGVILTAYSPLGTAKSKEDGALDIGQSEVLEAIAQKHETTPQQVALAWAVQRGTVAIPKSTNPKRQQENLAAADLQLSETDLRKISELDRGHRFITGEIWASHNSPYTLDWLWEGADV